VRAPSRSTGSPCVTSTRSTSSPVSGTSVGRKRCSYQVRRRSPSRCLGHTRSSPSISSTVSPKARARCDGSSNGISARRGRPIACTRTPPSSVSPPRSGRKAERSSSRDRSRPPGEQHADHQEPHLDHERAERVVHRRGLRRRGHDPVRPVAPAGTQRPFHPARADGVAHPPQRPDHLRHRGHRPRAAPPADRSRSSAPATASSSSPAKTTGTAPPPIAS
jgi:hypothetical protein